MGVYLKHLYDDVVAELGQGVGSNRLNSAFPRAVNRALSELENKADTGTDFAVYEDIDSTVTELEAKHEYILYAGIMYWLQRMGYRPGDARIATAVLNDTQRGWQAAKGDYIKDQVADAQDEGDEDIIGLGYLG